MRTHNSPIPTFPPGAPERRTAKPARIPGAAEVGASRASGISHLARADRPVHLVLFAAGHLDLTECEPVAWAVLSHLLRDLSTLAACLLPDRLEWLLDERRRLPDRVAGLTGASSRAARRLGLPLPLWGVGFVELPVDDVRSRARVLLELPVREGRVQEVPQWPWGVRRM